MDARFLGKSAKGLVIAAGLSLASGVLASAQQTPVALGAQATIPLSQLYLNPPTGSVTLGNVSFSLGNFVQLGNQQSVSYPVSVANASSVELLLNTSNTYWWYSGSVVGQVQLTFANGTTQTVPLTVGGNIREWRIGAGAMVVTTTTDPASTNVWSGLAQGNGGAAVIDMLTVTVPTPTTLTGISVSNSDLWGNLRVMVSGITVTDAPAKTTVTRPGNSGNTPAAQNSQAAQHSKSPVFNGGAPSLGTLLHTPGATVPSGDERGKGHNPR